MTMKCQQRHRRGCDAREYAVPFLLKPGQGCVFVLRCGVHKDEPYRRGSRVTPPWRPERQTA